MSLDDTTRLRRAGFDCVDVAMWVKSSGALNIVFRKGADGWHLNIQYSGAPLLRDEIMGESIAEVVTKYQRAYVLNKRNYIRNLLGVLQNDDAEPQLVDDEDERLVGEADYKEAKELSLATGIGVDCCMQALRRARQKHIVISVDYDGPAEPGQGPISWCR